MSRVPAQPFTDFDDAAAVDLGDGEQHVSTIVTSSFYHLRVF